MQFKPYYFESIYFDMYSYVASCISSQLIVAFLDFLGTNLEAAKNQLRTTVTFFFFQTKQYDYQQIGIETKCIQNINVYSCEI